MSKLPQLPDLFESSQSTSSLVTLNKAAAEQLKQVSVPTRQTESWRYSARHLRLDEAVTKQLPPPQTPPKPLPTQFSATRIVFVNGWFCEPLSVLPKDAGISLEIFSRLPTLTKTVEAQLIEASSDPAHPFAIANGANLADGARIAFGPGATIDEPVQIVFATTNACGASHARLVIDAAPGSRAVVIEEYLNLESEGALLPQFNTAVTQVTLEENAQIDLIRLALEPESTQHVGLTSVRQKRDSRFHHHFAGFGGQLKRHDLEVRLTEPGAFTRLNGACLTDNKQHLDTHTCIEHIAPHCESDETYRGIAGGASHSVFNGRILIHRDAQKSIGNMSNKNLLLSSNAEIDTKPELEIYADDVRCSHGATIGQLDKNALFYLISRGIEPRAATSMLSMGFIKEVLEGIPSAEVQSVLDKRLEQFLQHAFAGETTR